MYLLLVFLYSKQSEENFLSISWIYGLKRWELAGATFINNSTTTANEQVGICLLKHI